MPKKWLKALEEETKDLSPAEKHQAVVEAQAEILTIADQEGFDAETVVRSAHEHRASQKTD